MRLFRSKRHITTQRLIERTTQVEQTQAATDVGRAFLRLSQQIHGLLIQTRGIIHSHTVQQCIRPPILPPLLSSQGVTQTGITVGRIGIKSQIGLKQLPQQSKTRHRLYRHHQFRPHSSQFSLPQRHIMIPLVQHTIQLLQRRFRSPQLKNRPQRKKEKQTKHHSQALYLQHKLSEKPDHQTHQNQNNDGRSGNFIDPVQTPQIHRLPKQSHHRSQQQPPGSGPQKHPQNQHQLPSQSRIGRHHPKTGKKGDKEKERQGIRYGKQESRHKILQVRTLTAPLSAQLNRRIRAINVRTQQKKNHRTKNLNPKNLLLNKSNNKRETKTGNNGVNCIRNSSTQTREETRQSAPLQGTLNAQNAYRTQRDRSREAHNHTFKNTAPSHAANIRKKSKANRQYHEKWPFRHLTIS